MASKPDIVALKWVVGLMNEQADRAEAELVSYSNHPTDKKPLLHCMWAVHQITSTLRALGMKKGELLTIEMERGLNYIYKDKVSGERLKLTMGGIMQALKVLPAYLAHTQSARHDTGQGLEPHVNDLRRWLGERPRPPALFFYLEIEGTAGITDGAAPAPAEEVKSSADAMLALYLEMAKMALRGRNVKDAMKTVARIARKMQVLFAGVEVERFWLTMIGLCEGIAAGLIVPDECVAQILKSGAFLIKYARENGGEVDPAVDHEDYLQQMLFYVAACKSKPMHIARIRKIFAIDDSTIETANRGLVHIDAMMTALNGAMDQLGKVVEFLGAGDLDESASLPGGQNDTTALDGVDGAACRLEAAGQVGHADSLRRVHTKLAELYRGVYKESSQQYEKAVDTVIRGIVDVKIDIESKLKHGLSSSYCTKEYELRESVVKATFTHMSLVENYLHQVFRRKALASALATGPNGDKVPANLIAALKSYLNKTDQGHEELRQAVKQADNGEADIDLLYRFAGQYLDGLDDTPERDAVMLSLQLLNEIAGALSFAGMNRESEVIDQCHKWLAAAGNTGSVSEGEAFRSFADAFAQIELHLQRYLIDPLDDTSHMIACAERHAAELDQWSAQVSPVPDINSSTRSDSARGVQDADIPADFLQVFLDESEEIVADLTQLSKSWAVDPQVNDVLRDIRRHFHTFKGNGRAVGANVLGELGWAAQDMLDCVMEGEIEPCARVQELVEQVITNLPSLVASYKDAGKCDAETARELTNRCFEMARPGRGGDSPQVEQASGGPTVLTMQTPSGEITSH